jgi:D-alanyl-D-alanine carboxypeptidase/D-alanyl-D-alanine-endopeptidase (penicillin-binding protein 4)
LFHGRDVLKTAPKHPRPRGAIAALSVAIALLLGGGSSAAASPPDRAFKTPVAQGGAQAQAAVSAPALRRGLIRALKVGGGAGGAWVGDPETGAVLFSKRASRPFQIASNMKLFTTATALERLGPAAQLETQLIADGTFAGGVVQGNLVLEGGGDPSLTRRGIASLASEARAAGLSQVTGRLLYDETIFDRRRSVPQQGIRGGPFAEVGRLSGLSFEGGRSANPAKSAALSMIKALRKRGVDVSKKTARGVAPELTPTPVPVGTTPIEALAEVSSAPLSALARSTNTFSINFYAEMLVKSIAAEAQGQGTTGGGIGIIRSFAAEAGGALRAVNGSGLSRVDRASPSSVGALLTSMLKEEAPVRDAFLKSLAVAGGTGTLARRMRGTAAQGRCIGKTGTLDGVSALSGYCQVADGRFIAFSILMNGVSVSKAHVAQDRMTAMIARYTP